MAYFFRDITERRRRDAALQRTEKLAAVGRMASSISHEINNPLESVTNLLYLMENSADAGSELRTYAQLAASELARVSHIVTQTLKFHRQSTRATDTRMSEILESVLALFQSRIVTLHVEVRREYAADDDMLCFAGDMRQVFANLIGNSLDAMSTGGGTMRLRTRRAHSPFNGEPGIRITVADTGCGMSAAVQKSVFDAFFTTKGMTGSGWACGSRTKSFAPTTARSACTVAIRGPHGHGFYAVLPDRSHSRITCAKAPGIVPHRASVFTTCKSNRAAVCASGRQRITRNEHHLAKDPHHASSCPGQRP